MTPEEIREYQQESSYKEFDIQIETAAILAEIRDELTRYNDRKESEIQTNLESQKMLAEHQKTRKDFKDMHIADH